LLTIDNLNPESGNGEKYPNAAEIEDMIRAAMDPLARELGVSPRTIDSGHSWCLKMQKWGLPREQIEEAIEVQMGRYRTRKLARFKSKLCIVAYDVYDMAGYMVRGGAAGSMNRNSGGAKAVKPPEIAETAQPTRG